MIALSKRFSDRVNALFTSQVNRSKEKRGPTGRLSRVGYLLPFDRKQFTAWFLDQFAGAENSVIRCKYCRQPLDAYSCVVDHEVPLKRGGSPGLSNLGLPCEACNQIKGQLTPGEFNWFLDRMAEMNVRFPGSKCVQDITSRLQKAVKLAAAMRFSIARKQKQVVTETVEEDF